MTLLEAVTSLVARLEAHGVRSTTDTRNLNPPAVLVVPPDMSWRFARDTWDATWRLLCVVPNTGSASDLANLDTLIDQVRAALGGAPQFGTARTVTIDGTSDPLPAYELTWTS